MSEKEQVSVSRKAGALRSALNIALNTDYAINLWQGRPPEEEGKRREEKRASSESYFQYASLHSKSRSY